jgi:hypothetical protein
MAENSFVGVDMQTDWSSRHTRNLPPASSHQYASDQSRDSVISQDVYFAPQLSERQHDNIPTPGPNLGTSDYGTNGSEAQGDYNLFFDNFDTTNFYLPSTVFDSELPISLWSKPDLAANVEHETSSRQISEPRNENDALSRLGSRLPSLAPAEQDLMNSEPAPQADFLRAGPPWKISWQDHRQIVLMLTEFSSVLPDGFSLPSRHTLSRFFEGYISGFHQHLPFLHIPTFSISRCAPELFLAIAAVGAQYRFESTKGNKLWYAAKSVASEQIRRRQSQHVADILSSPTPSRASLSKSPASHTSPDNPNSNEHRNPHTSYSEEPSNDIR